MHIVSAQDFSEFVDEDKDPYRSKKLQHVIPVSTAPDTITKEEILGACGCTPIFNDDQNRDWNCHNWVGDVLAQLRDIGCWTEAERDTVIHKMADACLEAQDSPSA